MNFEEYLKINAQKIETELNKILLEFLEDTRKVDQRLLTFAKGFKNACLGGKRIRGVLVKLGNEIAMSSWLDQDLEDSGVSGYPPDPQNDIFKIGAGLEILHTGLLIHDDIIDQSPQRRGQPSLHQILGGDHYGISQAITLGDIGLTLGFKVITQSNFPSDSKIKALEYLSQVVIKTGFGQVLDVEFSLKKNTKEKDIKLLYSLKTAKYTIAGPLIIGALLGGADEKLVKMLGDFGENLGIAFQIQDDILDSESQLVNAQKQAFEYTKRAKKIIPKITTNPDMKKLLMEMTKYMVERSK